MSAPCGVDAFIMDPNGSQSLDLIAHRHRAHTTLFFGTIDLKGVVHITHRTHHTPTGHSDIVAAGASMMFRLYDYPPTQLPHVSLLHMDKDDFSKNTAPTEITADGAYRTRHNPSLGVIYAKQPEDAAGWFNQGLNLERSGQLNDALDAYRKVFEADPDISQPEAHIRACTNMGTLYLMAGNFSAAAYTFGHALELDSGLIDIRHNYAVALWELKQEAAAIHQWSLALNDAYAAIREIESVDQPVENLPHKTAQRYAMAKTVVSDATNILTGISKKGDTSTRSLAHAVIVRHDPANQHLPNIQKQIPAHNSPNPNRNYSAKQLVELSKTVSHALRHAPWEYELELNADGWVDISALIEAISRQPRWEGITRSTFDLMVRKNNDNRLEIDGNRVRARYGHSIPGRIPREPGTPPTVLYHGTDKRFLKDILAHGLKPITRHHVHLSATREKAAKVARRKGEETVILVVSTKPLLERGVKFYSGNEDVWLVDELLPDMFDIES